MKIQTSTCHICLEELSFDSKDIKKMLSNKSFYL